MKQNLTLISSKNLYIDKRKVKMNFGNVPKNALIYRYPLLIDTQITKTKFNPKSTNQLTCPLNSPRKLYKIQFHNQPIQILHNISREINKKRATHLLLQRICLLLPLSVSWLTSLVVQVQHAAKNIFLATSRSVVFHDDGCVYRMGIRTCR